MNKYSPILNVTPYNNILALLDKPMTTREIVDVLGISKEMCNHQLHRLMVNECVKRTRDEDGAYKNSKRNPFYYTRIVERIEGLEIAGKYVKEEEPAQVNPYARVIAERHTYSERKKSPRVYVGCSFNQVGW